MSARASFDLTVAGEQVRLHPERALELPRLRTLVIADLHLGKATALRAHGVPVPPGSTTADLARLDALLRGTSATSLLVLGDLAHSRHGWQTRALEPVRAWRAAWPSLEITLVRGNHDMHAGHPPADLAIAVVDAPYQLGAFTCAHEPPSAESQAVDADAHRVTLCGHLHPHARLAGRGRDRVRLPCFVQRGQTFVLPAFSSFTGGGAWSARPDDEVWAVVGDAVSLLG